MTRHPLSALLVASVLLLAGCAGGISGSPADSTATSAGSTEMPGDPTGTPADSTATSGEDGSTAGTGTIDFYISDEENAIGDFAHLNVTVTRVGFQRGGEAGGWIEHDLDDVTVDLTELQGPKSAYVDSYDLPNGEYTKVFVYVSEVQATLEGGEEVRVKLPSEKLHLTTDFTLENGSEVEFVFDITVKRAGNSGKYILQPVITESGTDVPIEKVDGDEEDSTDDGDGKDGENDHGGDDDGESDAALEAAFEGNVTAGENATLIVTRNGSAVEDANVTVNDELVGATDADGELTVAVPEADAVTVVVEADGDEVELEYEFE